MINSLCLADTGGIEIIDIVLLVVLALFAIIGIFSGFAKMLKGAFGTFLAIIISVICAIFLSEKLMGVSFLVTLSDLIEDKLGDAVSATAYLAKVDGGVVVVERGGDWVALTSIYGEGFKAKIVQLIDPMLVKLCGGYLDGTGSVAFAVASLVTLIVSGAIIVVGGIIVIEIVASILSKLFSLAVSKQKAFKTVDRLLGLVIAAAVGVLIIFAAFFIIVKLGDKAGPVLDMIESSSIGKWFFDNNPFAVLLG